MFQKKKLEGSLKAGNIPFNDNVTVKVTPNRKKHVSCQYTDPPTVEVQKRL